MITEFSIEGFKSFGSPAEVVQLGSLNVVVGANASGKSNFIDALRFLQNAVIHDVSYAVSELGGTSEVGNKRLRQRREPKPVRFTLRLDDEFTFAQPQDSEEEEATYIVQSFEYSLSLDLRSDVNPRIEAESLSAETVRHGGKRTVGLRRDGKEIVVFDPTTGDKEERKITVPEQEQNRLALVGVGFFCLPAVILRDVIRSWSFHNISPGIARRPYREEPDAKLGTAGENLATIIHRMTDEDRASIAQGLSSVVPGLKRVKTTRLPIEEKLVFQIVEDKLRAAINPVSVSDGTVRLLALLVATTWSVRESSLLTIEEPENGVHAARLPWIASLFEEAARDGVTQFIINTHSAQFPGMFSRDESLALRCYKNNGGVTGFEAIDRRPLFEELGIKAALDENQQIAASPLATRIQRGDFL